MGKIKKNNLDLSEKNIKKSNQKLSIKDYFEEYRRNTYIIGNYNNLGFSEELEKKLLDTGIIKKVAKGWQLPQLDWYAVEDFSRGYKCSKVQIATYAFRSYLPQGIYDFSTALLLQEYYKNEYNIVIEDTVNTVLLEDHVDIEEYNSINNKVVNNITSNYQQTMMKFSYDFFKIDAMAVELFKERYKFDYNKIVTYAIRSFLSEQNYKNAEEILDIMDRQDKNRQY